MTADELAKLSDDEKRIKIAEACGAKWGVDEHGNPALARSVWLTDGDGDSFEFRDICIIDTRGAPHGMPFIVVDCPDFINDLNAMHHAESFLSPAQQRSYGFELHDMLCQVMESNGCKTQADREARPEWVWHATSKQRANAFLLCLP